ncbi:hypothetical protein D3C74_473900 [compost metagenome]
MKLHPDGTLEGTAEEIMKYQQLKVMVVKPIGVGGIQQAPAIGNPLIPWTTTGVDAGKYPGDGTIYTTNVPSKAQLASQSTNEMI